MTSIVLAGGKSTRLGRDKVWEKVGEQSLLGRVVLSLAPLGTDILVVTRSGQTLPPLPYHLPVKRAYDLYPGRGSLGGLYTGLMTAASSPCLVVACDMPFLNQRLLGFLLALGPSFDVVVPYLNGYLEPLHAVYSRGCLGPIKELLDAGEQRIYDLFPKVRVRQVEAAEVDALDPEHRSFFNINTQADLDWAREVASRSDAASASLPAAGGR